MHKLVILIDHLEDEERFDELWPEFLHISEGMPGLLREATCRVDANLYGEHQPAFMHELFFESVEDIQQALSSTQGTAAGALLQRMTGGKMSLFIADHKEDEIENIRRFQQEQADDS